MALPSTSLALAILVVEMVMMMMMMETNSIQYPWPLPSMRMMIRRRAATVKNYNAGYDPQKIVLQEIVNNDIDKIYF